MKVGIFGGTFNPVHYGHINLAIELKEKSGLDEVWFIPAHCSPFRASDSLVEGKHRFNLLQLALADIPGFKALDLELRRPPPSYTIDTIDEIVSCDPKNHYYLLLGEDSLLRFSDWKKPDEIVKKIPLLIGSRLRSQLLERLPTLGFSSEIEAAIVRGVMPTRQMEISATDMRDRLKKRLYCGHCIPGKVLDYIYENQLYFTP